MPALLDQSIQQLRSQLATRSISVAQLVQESLAQIEKLNPSLNAFISVVEKAQLLALAKNMDAAGPNPAQLLWGIPFSVKDVYVSPELPTTAASHILENFTSPYTSTVVQKLRDAGAVLIGKNNMDAWGHGGSNENSDYGVCHNPWDVDRISGGSSGGCAVAVSTRMVTFAIGEDTGGSIRNPASMCSISGLKVTYGRVSRYGAIAYASSLDTVGPMAKTAEDLAVVLEVMAGKDDHDATSSTRVVPKYVSLLSETKLQEITVGVPKEFFGEGIDPEVQQLVQDAIAALKSKGVKVIDVTIPLLPYAIAIYYLIAASETSSNLGRYDGIRYGKDRSFFSQESARRILLGSYALSAGYADKLYKKAQRARTALIQDYEKAFSNCTVLISPVVPTPPQLIGELINNPLQNMVSDLLTVTTNVVGIPAVAIPAGFTQAGLPVGLQLMARKFEEPTLLSIAHQYQQITDWHHKTPPLLTSEEKT